MAMQWQWQRDDVRMHVMSKQAKWDEANARLLELRRQYAEASTTHAGKYDRRQTSRASAAAASQVAELERRIREAEGREYNVRVVLERQYTIKKLWIAPKPTYLAAKAELAALEARLAQCR